MNQAIAPRGRYSPPSPEQVAAVIVAMERGLTLAAACAEARCSYTTLRSRAAKDEALSESIEAAKARFHTRVIDEMTRRAITGVERIVFHGGAACGVETRFSDRLLLRLADLIPEYSPARKIEHTGTVIHAVAHSIDSAILAALDPVARIQVRRALLLENLKDASDSEKQSAVLALAQDASRDGIELDMLAMARTLRIGKLADAVDVEFEEVETAEDIERQLDELKELF